MRESLRGPYHHHQYDASRLIVLKGLRGVGATMIGRMGPSLRSWKLQRQRATGKRQRQRESGTVFTRKGSLIPTRSDLDFRLLFEWWKVKMTRLIRFIKSEP